MSVEHVEILVEEPSMEAALRPLLPKVLGSTSFQVYPSQGKHDLLKRLEERLRGYSRWLPANWRIMVVVDRDNDSCRNVKTDLENKAARAFLTTRSATSGGRYQVVNRLAIEELEAWYFGDWDAVRAAYPKAPPTIPSRAKYRNPDTIRGGTWEALERILQRAGYFRGGLRKIEAARAVAPHMTPEQNRSKSFQVFHAALREMAS